MTTWGLLSGLTQSGLTRQYRLGGGLSSGAKLLSPTRAAQRAERAEARTITGTGAMVCLHSSEEIHISARRTFPRCDQQQKYNSRNPNRKDCSRMNLTPAFIFLAMSPLAAHAQTTQMWHPTYSAGWANGYCRYTTDTNSPGYSSQLACCKGAYAGQISGYCLSQLPAPPTSSPTDTGGLDVWYPGACVDT